MAKKQFKSESKKLLELMINSIYTNKDIFLRELISNASDAIDKEYYLSLTEKKKKFNKSNFYIKIDIDKKARTLTITDTGIGMTKEELDENLGTIAKSGSLAFKLENKLKEKSDIIGQFGVGFYSAFMVADKVTVISKTENDEAYIWESEGVDGYTINKSQKDSVGTTIILKMKENDDNNYDEYLDEYKLKSLIKKYSDFIKYPIKMITTKTKLKDDQKDEYEEYTEEEVINSMVPIWKKQKNKLTEEDYNNFYFEKRFGFDKPLHVIHTTVDGTISYDALLYIPSSTPFDFYTKEYEKGLELYSNNVLIMEKCSELLPDYFGFVKGLVDSKDVSLNISREMLQQDKQLHFIAKKIKDKIKSELLKLLKNEPDKYKEFFKNFGRIIKFGTYNNWGQDKDFLQDLLMFYSSNTKELITLDDYINNMKEDQTYIYYATGENLDKIDKLPQTEFAKDKGYEILYLTEEIDEFVVKILMKYKDKEFKSVAIDTEEHDEKCEYQEIFTFMKEVLKDKVKDVKASNKLKTHPVCITSSGEISVEMEKVLNMMPDSNVKAEKVLEINTNHEIFNQIKDLHKNDLDKLTLLTNVLYNQSLLIEGLSIEDPVEYANNIYELLKNK